METGKADYIGIASSLLCLIHCTLVPLLLAAHPALLFWTEELEYFDYIFISISFVAVYFSASRSNFLWITIAFWVLFFIFLISMIFHDDFTWLIHIAYIASIGLALTHLLNILISRKYKH